MNRYTSILQLSHYQNDSYSQLTPSVDGNAKRTSPRKKTVEKPSPKEVVLLSTPEKSECSSDKKSKLKPMSTTKSTPPVKSVSTADRVMNSTTPKSSPVKNVENDDDFQPLSRRITPKKNFSAKKGWFILNI